MSIRSLAILLICLVSQTSFGQGQRLVAIGSSTTAGYRADPLDSSWFVRCTKYYRCQAGVIDTSFNLGVPGYDVYAAMPNDYVPPQGRPIPDNSKNISQALLDLQSLPDPSKGVIIVNYPTNEYNIFSIDEIMNCLQLIYDSATSAGNRCYITTTQPRTDSAFNSPKMKRKLADIKDSIIGRFGEAHTINFWDGMFNPADSSILDLYESGDNVHFNNRGHGVLFERILAKNIFNLPVWYSASSGNLNLLSTWGANKNGSGTHPASFALDNQTFIIVNNPSPTISANWTLRGTNVKLVVGDGIHPVNLKIPALYKITINAPQVASSCPP